MRDELGWAVIDHAQLGTEARYGPWAPIQDWLRANPEVFRVTN